MNVPVAIHRWHADGEGWSYHPDLEEGLARFVTQASQHLKNRHELQRGVDYEVEFSMPGGQFVVGMHRLDAECPDPKAKGRSPSILSLAVLPHQPGEGEKMKIRSLLERINGVERGMRGQLSIAISLSPAGPSIVDDRDPAVEMDRPKDGGKGEKSTGQWPLVWVGLGVLVVLVIGLFWWNGLNQNGLPGGGNGNGVVSGTDLKNRKHNYEVSTDMWNQLGKWGIKDVKKPEKISAQTFLLTDSTQPDVINRFFRFLSQQECKADKSTGRFHPDLLFVTRLPASSPSKKSWTVLEVNDALKKLLRRLKTGEDVAAGKKSSTESSNDILIKKNSALLKSVVKEMNYQAWIYTRDYIRVARSLNGSAVSNAGIKKGANIDSTGAWVGNQFLWDVPPAREVNKYIRRFGLNDRSARGWEQAAAKEMVKLLNGWGVAGVVEGDADERPWFVTHCFFQFLSRSGLKQNLPNTALTPWHDQFVQLMPEGPVAVKTSYGTEDDLREDLSKLRLKLKAESGVLVLTLLANCAEKLEYGGWKVRMEDLYGSVNNPPTKTEGSADPRVNAFVERFKKSKED